MIERSCPYWYVHTWDRTRDAQRSFRLDRMRSARLQRETFEPREGFRPDRLQQRRGHRTDLVLEEDRALEGRGRRPAALGRRGARGQGRRQRGVARRRDPGRPWRGRSARAGRSAQAGRRTARRRSHASCASAGWPRRPIRRGRPATRARRSCPRPGVERTSSDPPWACAIERAMKSPRPVPGFACSPLTRPNFSKMSAWCSRRDSRAAVAHLDADPAVLRERLDLDLASPAGEYLTALSSRFVST